MIDVAERETQLQLEAQREELVREAQSSRSARRAQEKATGTSISQISTSTEVSVQSKSQDHAVNTETSKVCETSVTINVNIDRGGSKPAEMISKMVEEVWVSASGKKKSKKGSKEKKLLKFQPFKK